MNRFWLFLGAVLMLLFGSARYALANTDVVTDKLGKTIDNIEFTDLDGKTTPLHGVTGKKAVVVVFLSFDCPVSNSYSTTLAELQKQYGDQGVAFVAVAAGDDSVEVKKQAAEFKISFPVYLDPKLNVTDAFKATATPEAFVLDHNFVLRYRGRIDDVWMARLKKNSHARVFDLRNALDDLLANRDIKVPATRPIGCPVLSKGAIAKPVTTKITYHKDVEPILQTHCQSCHRPDAVGPFSLLSYKQAVSWADDIKTYTEKRAMPPWKPTGGHAFYADRRLADEQIKLLAAWVDGGAPEGDPKDAPKALDFSDGWQLGKPDLILSVQDDFTLGASGRDAVRGFVLPTNFEEDKHVVSFEVRPSNRRVAHHTLNYWDTSGTARKFEERAKQAAKSSDSDRGPGFSAVMRAGFRLDPGTFGNFGGWTPGQVPRLLPKGTAYFIPKGADLIILTHYHRNGKEEKDRLQIGLYFAKEKIEKPYQFLVASGFGSFETIPPGQPDYKTRGTAVVDADCTIYSVFPHMHLLGKTVKVTMTPPGGKEETLVKIDDWDFNWQETYWLKEPISVKAGTRFGVEALFDNSEKNPNNPSHPPIAVRFGEQTTNEMLYGYLGGTTAEQGIRLVARSLQNEVVDDPTPPADYSSKLLGDWDLTKLNGKPPGKGDSTTLQVSKDGKYKLHAELNGKTHRLDGPYKLDGKKLTLVANSNDKAVSEEFTIRSLTADSLVVRTFRGGKEHEMEFKKK